MNVLFVGATPKERASSPGCTRTSSCTGGTGCSNGPGGPGCSSETLAQALSRLEELETRVAALEKALAKRPARTRKTPE